MDTIETIKKDKTYLKYKLLVKNWEKEFKAKHSRIPSKCDIKEAPVKVRYAYKQYFQLKSVVLENSLIDCEVPSEHIPDLISLSDGLIEDCPSPGTVDLLNKLPSGEQLQVLLSNESATNSMHNTQTPIILGNDNTLTPYTKNLSKKLFQNSRFNFRNPRKSLSLKCSQTTNKTVITGNRAPSVEDPPEERNSPKLDLKSVLQENEFSILNKSSTVNVNNSVPINIMNTYNVCKEIRQVNEGWLERASGLDIKSVSKTCPKTLGIRNISIQNIEKINDYIENSETEDDDYSLNKLKPALKKRKIGYDLNCSSTKNYATFGNSSSDSLQNEKLIKTKTRSRQKLKLKDENEEPPNLDEYLPFGLENDVTPRHAKSSIVFQTKINTINSNEKQLKKSKKYLNNEDRLQEKIKNGTLNENFVKINIEKKVFVRGKKSFNFSKYKKQQWKHKKLLSKRMEFPESGKILCYKCGQDGHMARYCTAQKGDNLLPLSAYKPDIIPSLQEMENQESSDLTASIDEELLNLTTFEPSPIPQAILNLLSSTSKNENKDVSIKPIYDYYDQETPQELVEALHMFGHESFRSGQEQVMKRILCGLSTLLILSTGSGKSLCYQLPAYIYKKYYKCVTLVISPLVSLMEDQVLNMPDFLKAGCLHTNQPPSVRKKIIQYLKDGEISVLLISPEALVLGDGSNGFGGLFKALPPIAFACIDEAHCVSQWSHNFRPSYLMICRVLKEKLKVKCILGLTATASKATITSIVNHINIPDGSKGVVTNPTLPNNLTMSVSHETDKDFSLITLLNMEPVNSYSSIIIYCIRRNECERLATLLRSSLQDPRVRNMEKYTRKRKRLSLIAEAYHAGISAVQRKRIQNNFMDGTLRIIVATIAFGMGINKSDIRCIIHYNMPSSFESYVQEVGRAGRDCKKALCHVLMNNHSNDKNELLKHVYSNTMDRSVIRKLLEKVFIPCDCGKSQDSCKTDESMNKQKCTGHEVAIPIDETVEELDIASENIATLLCYLELDPLSNVKVLNNAYTTCKIFSYGGPQAIIKAAGKCPPLAMACKLERNKNTDISKNNILEFPVIEVAAAMGWESGVTKYYLKNLEWDTAGGNIKRSQFTVQFHKLGFRIKAPGDLTPTELDRVLDCIHETVQSQERKMVYQLEEIDRAFRNMAKLSIQSMNFSEENEQLMIQSNELKSVIRDYFTRDTVVPNNIVLKERPLDEAQIISDIRALIHAYRDCKFTGRSIARIFQGIASPNYPAIVWSRCKFWRSHMHEDFYGLVRLATQQLFEMKVNEI